jgi:6-phosphogluconolactonase (cycloisomerase 2 family)
MDISPDGQWLFALDGSLGSTIVSLYEFQIDSSTGTLTPWPTSVGGVYSYAITTAAPTPTPSAIKVSPDGTFVFVALGTGGDLAIPFTTASGLLATPTQMTLASLPQYTSDNALAVNSSSTILYIARSSSASKGVVAAYSIGAGGLLSLEAEGTTGVYPTAVVLNSAGTDVYVANRTDGTISGFSTTASGGVLSPLGGSPYSSGSLVDALAVDNSGDYLLTASFGGSSDLTMYSYDSTTAGKLDISAATSTGTDPTGPIAIATTH